MDFDTWDALRHGSKLLAQDISKQIYCHYTTPEAFSCIFADHLKKVRCEPITKCVMRASHIRFMNDSREYLDGCRWFKRYCKTSQTNEINGDMYSISFCGDEDLLSQWKWYGKNSGIAITFDMSNIKFKYYDVTCPALPDEDSSTRPLPVHYTTKGKKEYFEKIDQSCKEKQLNQSSALFRGNLFVPFCKDKGFKEEKESRLIFYTADADTMEQAGIAPFNIRYVVSGNIIKPILDVEFRAKDPGRGIVKRITVGPGQNQELVYQGLVHILCKELSSGRNKTSAHGMTIQKSSIPFRG